MSNTPQNRHDNRRLPAGWRLADGWLYEPGGYARNVLNDAGRIDALRIATILENYGEREHAAAWRGGPKLTPEQLHGPAAFAALRAIVAVASDYTVALPVPALRMYDLARETLLSLNSPRPTYGRTTVAPGAFSEVESGTPSPTADR